MPTKELELEEIATECRENKQKQLSNIAKDLQKRLKNMSGSLQEEIERLERRKELWSKIPEEQITTLEKWIVETENRLTPLTTGNTADLELTSPEQTYHLINVGS